MRLFGKSGRVRLMFSVAAGALAISSGAAWAQDKAKINIAPQGLTSALYEFGSQTSRQVMFTPGVTASKTTAGVSGVPDEQAALEQLLNGTGLTYRTEGDVFVIVQAGEGGSSPQGAGADEGAVEALIVTAQKREEAIQDVPIAISAFSQRALEEQKIEGGFDLLKAIPNVTFSKTNFSSYNFSIRGVGTKAVSATTDPGVAVAFNNTTLIHNRLFEQEYFDVERVEVLRGPQGTLYGRNATSGVINVISAKPDLGDFEASAKAEIGNYDARRLVGMVNIPIVEDMLAVRLAAAGTQRSGFDYNETTGNNVNGRELWSGRVTVGFEPLPALRANLLWEHFEEDDNRSRTSKQLCHRDDGKTVIGNTPLVLSPQYNPGFQQILPAIFSQACRPGSLFDPGAFDTPNGFALPFVFGGMTTAELGQIGSDANNKPVTFMKLQDPFSGLQQSRDLRTIASIKDPVYRAKADVFDLAIDFDITDALTLTSQTVYNEDEVYSFQDFNRFNTAPAFTDTSGPGINPQYRNLAPGGVFCDPQIGCSDKIAGFDISQSVSEQFSQELRLSSNFDGPVNFSFGANYTEFDALIDYYVFYNVITALAMTGPFYYPLPSGEYDLNYCYASGAFEPLWNPGLGPVDAQDPLSACPYVDPNPIESINGEGHNYFRSKNPYSLKSKAVFGEIYWRIDDALKLTAGLRYTDDRKTFTPVPSQVLLASGILAGGVVSRGYPEEDPIKQKWGEWTGRLGLDWKPELGFTDETMVYAFYSRGYKGGGANPPTPDFATIEETVALMEATLALLPNGGAGTNAPQQLDVFIAYGRPLLKLTAVEYGPTFEPEFVDAFEIGAKNTLLGGAMTFNATGFYYDYRDYQVSQIRDRTAVNENFDATIWGLEFETVFAPSRNLKFNANFGYLDTKIADGETSIDIMNRTQSDPNYVVIKPWVQLPSNCVIPLHVAEAWANNGFLVGPASLQACYVPATLARIFSFGGLSVRDPLTGAVYDPLAVDANGDLLYPEINGGAGLRDDVGGNELPNAPHWTMNFGGQYGRDILGGSWRVVMRGDAYWQAQSWARVYNAVNDKLHGWYNFNVSVRLENEDLGLEAEFYVKNLLDKSPITDAFLNSDDTGLTTNVFVLDPRLVGFSLRKTF